MWYLLDVDEQGDEIGIPFTKEQLDVFQAYTLNNTVNFPADNKQYKIDEENVLEWSEYHEIPDPELRRPQIVLLKKRPMQVYEGVQGAMEITLANETLSMRIPYTLPFDVVGEILSKSDR
ncbi:hypothetical protein SIO70_14635 [Chitinophaga sancti]|uniref:hypothetical protein n=1 Tax=Chitinophaga sancti TaxID=1004 RepID=UPI002A751F46|nr:hypothetical protein [Chitinophaga sancti]WPQ66096.1 hypothetical protein SIO70_14635 [Chitinophaga sancti]